MLHRRSGGAQEVIMRNAMVLSVFTAIILIALLSTRGHSQARSIETPTFTASIAPILYANCVTCHRPGEVAPFPLISYEDVAKRGKLIAKVTGTRYMPPWHAAHGYEEFVGERGLTDAQIAIIAAWVSNGMPRG